jgi:protoporphyrinogen oxidase
MTEVVILGAGPAGLAAALELAEAGSKTTLVEREAIVGGNAASIELNGIYVDYGSHRLHPASDPSVLKRIRDLLGDDLLTRPRHGRIRLMGRWIHFPLRPIDLLLRSNPKFSIGVAFDLMRKLFPGPKRAVKDNFASILRRGLGNTICKEFYFPFAKKIWGLAPTELSAIQARKRVSAGSIGKMLKRLLPGGAGSGGASTKGIFYYPRFGFGQISQSLHQAALSAGADVLLSTNVIEIRLKQERPVVVVEGEFGRREIVADQIYSTIPVTVLAQLIDIDVPKRVQDAARALEFRSMLLVYMELATPQFTEFDAHYFPGADIPFTRVSEPRNYSDREEPSDRTILCVEIPCFKEDATWSMTNEELGDMVIRGLKKAGLPIGCEVNRVESRRIPFAYPLYRDNYEQHYDVLDRWIEELDNVLSFGRQGLYAHDNTHHAMFMAKAAAECLGKDGKIDRLAWRTYREVFESHVVED